MVTVPANVRAVASGYGLGIGGAVLAAVLSLAGILVLALVGVASLPARLAVLFVLGQYVPFIGFPIAYLRWRGFDWGGIRDYFGVEVPSLREVGIVVAGFFAVLVLTLGTAVVVTQVLGLEPANNSTGELAQDVPSIVPLLVLASLVVIGPSEETLFRGTVQNRLRESLPAGAAIVLTAALFAAVHVTALTGSLGARGTTIVILFVPSLVFGVVYEYTRNLVVPALIHGIWNSFVFGSIYVSTQFGPGTAAALLGL
ncbi:CPBP family intramembrane glutamic endopeptidase [Halobaculum litoreum]|uniref:CPBP family intramembrane glutamic endopeptidase n=1 Tax=Halobaculum litoreum TaxID=3031998 RepID=UPI0024C384E8|nr:type II CAAX endopeptidase family protein [Halobaculum sp. DT92]